MKKEGLRHFVTTLRARADRFVADHPNVKTIVTNIGWLSFDTILRMVVGLFIATWVARYLQPSYFGELNYALAIVALLGAPAGLGVSDIVVRDIVNGSEQAATLLGTALFNRLAAALVFYAGIVVYAWELPNPLTRQLLLISGLALCIQALTVFGLRFKADLRSKLLVIAGNVGFAVSALYRVYLVLARRPVVEFAWVAIVEAAAGALMMMVLYSKSYADLSRWRFCFRTAKQLLGQSWPLILSAIAVTTYMRIDQIMIAQMLGTTQVGLYAAATKLSEITYVIPAILAGALFPSVVRSKSLGPERYAARMQGYFDVSAGLAYLIVIPCVLVSPLLIHLLYGKEYQSSAGILTIQIWALLFVSLGVAREQFLVAEGHLKLSFVSTSLGAILNIAINLLLIPRYGAAGAALATVLTQCIVVMMPPLLYTPTRQMSLQLFRAILLPLRSRSLLRAKNILTV